MFTGIIEKVGEVAAIKTEARNIHFCIKSELAAELKVDQSVAHNGVCLTVTCVEEDSYWVTAVHETLSKSNLSDLHEGSSINLERCMLMNARLDGHIVQGHVDQIAKVEDIIEQDGSWQFDFTYDTSAENVTVEKGSVTVNGVSLTCFNSKSGGFSVAIIPYTYEHTNFNSLKIGDKVNLEFDIIGKYVKVLMRK